MGKEDGEGLRVPRYPIGGLQRVRPAVEVGLLYDLRVGAPDELQRLLGYLRPVFSKYPVNWLISAILRASKFLLV